MEVDLALNLTDRLASAGIPFEILAKSEKIRLMARWNTLFQPLSAAARKGVPSTAVHDGAEGEAFLASVTDGTVYLLPNDASAAPSVCCGIQALPWLAEMTADNLAGCEEIVIIDRAFSWSCVLVNHGASGVGYYASNPESRPSL